MSPKKTFGTREEMVAFQTARMPAFDFSKQIDTLNEKFSLLVERGNLTPYGYYVAKCVIGATNAMRYEGIQCYLLFYVHGLKIWDFVNTTMMNESRINSLNSLLD